MQPVQSQEEICRPEISDQQRPSVVSSEHGVMTGRQGFHRHRCPAPPCNIRRSRSQCSSYRVAFCMWPCLRDVAASATAV